MAQSSGWLERQWWTATRFGVTPQKLLNRVRSRSMPKIVTISIPKSGTHLLERILCLHPELYRPIIPTINPDNVYEYGDLNSLLGRLKPSQVLVTHLYYSENYAKWLEESDAKVLFMVRDPRDVVISSAHFESPKHHLREQLDAADDIQSRIELLVKGDTSSNIPPIAEYLAQFTGWMKRNCMVVRFEELTGDVDTRERTIENIFSYIGLPVDRQWLRKSLLPNVISPSSPTFRSGKPSQWVTKYDDATLELFRQFGSDLLIEMGYETSHDWIR